MDTKKLRQKILDLAIRGKLVPQDPNDEPASVLLERIRAEKERLIKEGKIKRSKKSAKSSDTPHYENDVPFKVPDSWEWTTIGEIASSILYGVSESAKEEGVYKLLRITDIQNNKVNWESVPFTDYDEKKAQAYLLEDGDILFARTGATVGKSYLVENLNEQAIYASYLIRVQTPSVILPSYIKYFFESGFYWEQISFNSVGIGQPNVNGTTLAALTIPIPPYQEQIRIAEEAKKWLSIIDNLDIEKEGLSKYIDVTKSYILELAIHGKLVPQDLNDEPAIDLLKRINSSFVPCDNEHYENVPEGWTTIRLGDLCFTINGLWKGKKPPFVNVGVIRNANFTKDFQLDYSNIAYLDVEEKQYEKRKLKSGDIIVEKSGGSDNQPVGRTIFFDKAEGEYSFSNFTSVLRVNDGFPVLPEYLNMFLHAVYQQGTTKKMQTQTTGIHNLIFDQFLTMPVLLPSLAEQKRIMRKVYEIKQVIDNISSEL